jgi:hypothetical protein
MYLHVGNNRNIRKSSVIGIFDMDKATMSGTTRKSLGRMQKQLRIETASLEIPKSLVLYEDFGDSRICMSPISVSALIGRMENDIEN